MSATRKVRTDAKLKMLPKERQSDIANHLLHHTLDQTKAWLRASGLNTSSASLSEFLSWYRLGQHFQESELKPVMARILEVVVEIKAALRGKSNPE